MRDFDIIYREFHPKISRYLTHLVGEDDAHDLARVVPLKVSRSLDGFRGDSSLTTGFSASQRTPPIIISSHQALSKGKGKCLPMTPVRLMNSPIQPIMEPTMNISAGK